MNQAPIYCLWEKIVKKESIKIAIDGSTYKYEDESLKALRTLSYYKQFEIFYISNQDIDKKNNIKIFLPEYLRKTEIILKGAGSKETWVSGIKNDSTKNILPIELIGAIAFGDLVVTKTDLYSKYDKFFLTSNFDGKNPYIGDLSGCLSAIRAWINNQYKLSTRSDFSYHFSSWLSVTFATKILLPYLDDAWRAAVVTKEDKNPLGEGTVRDFLSGILSRAKHLLTTRDLLEVLKLNSFSRLFNPKVDNIPYMVTYYFGYYFLLITAMIDSSCWITNWRINRKTRNYELTFRKNNRHFKPFITELAKFNSEFSDYIESASVQSYLNLIYYIRNFIAHNILPNGIRYVGFEGLSGDLISIKGKIEDILKEYSKCNNIADTELLNIGTEIKRSTADRKDDEKLFDPVLFSRYILMRAMEFIDTIFKYLSIEKKILTAKDEQNEFERLEKISLETKKNDEFNEFIENTNKALVEIEASIP